MTESNSKCKTCDICGGTRGVKQYNVIRGIPVEKELCYKHYNQCYFQMKTGGTPDGSFAACR